MPGPITHNEIGNLTRNGEKAEFAVPQEQRSKHAFREQYHWRGVGDLTPGRNIQGVVAG